MTTQQIQILFNEVIAQRGIHNQIEGVTEDRIYNWRNGRKTPTLGEMLNVLYVLNKIKISQL